MYLKRSQCYMTGYIGNITDSSVSLDICGNLSGVIRHGDKRYVIKDHTAFSEEYVQTENKTVCNREFPIYGSMESSIMMNYKRQRRSTTETLMIELYVVMDYALFSEAAIGKNNTKAIQYIERMVNHIDQIYSPMGIRVLLVGVEIWTAKQADTPSTDATELLDQFLSHAKKSIRQTVSVDYDLIALITGKSFGGQHVGIAHVNAMCGDQSGAVIQDDRTSSTREMKSAVVLAHEIGHVLGMLHDDAACTCLDPKDCVMNSDITQLPTSFSSCSAKIIKKVKETGVAPCLYNVPDVIYNGPICGNGIKEKGEVCDCGGKQECKKSQCCTDTCQLKHGAKCDSGGCCHHCQVVKANKLCRPAQNECDLDEVCDGKSEQCPASLYKQDLYQCGQGLDVGYCYRGQCRSNLIQCQNIWGSTGKSAHVFCFTENKKGIAGGNCGTIGNSIHRKCNDSDKMCGVLMCNSNVSDPVFGGGSQIVSERSMTFPQPLGTITCKGATINLGPDVPDPGLVDDGSPCYTNTNTKSQGICINKKCVDINTITIPSCPVDVNGTICFGNGICNNLDKCWCKHGYTSSDCSVKIVIPGRVPEKNLTVIHIVLISAGSGIFILGLTAGIIVVICHKKKTKEEKTKHKDKDKKKKHKDKEEKSKTAWGEQNGDTTKKKSVAFRQTKIRPMPPSSHRL
ncbi:disintegrin and metalloproteinase domain-containing protein 12-like [Mytilus edulis]|uniref:disintegrin and metalloproteinase domain-containing protein 12-like n=1 Tax=Mytilus edulis TaxID=6550 RepID=UPI0039F0CE97